ncbi:HNH endonuclease signature motif containing protein [Mycoplasmopsis verecunda]|uniref:HNH endonuclease n=1 Tax=Mycoplasmopsis verecunda TaxID=171291 RepID=A0A1T4KXM0_9BACT|nr:HNH endonuclease signature motif containing protein [Mycoplasmopsis verecunda]WPB54330.1 HNH endonuclease signature motif containing protein [Mycoplasmopsis verecunda]SJZ47141.1 HNH endonuclease [Mycoplasmopsis verecunda]
MSWRNSINKRQFWRAPGNKRIFDGELSNVIPVVEERNIKYICNFYSYHTLQYFMNNKDKDFIYNNVTLQELFDYLQAKLTQYHIIYDTNTVKGHLIKSLVFYKLLQIYDDGNIKKMRITFAGVDFYEKWNNYLTTKSNELLSNLIDSFVRLLLDVKYPSNSLYKVTDNMHLYPFRIFFVMLDKFQHINKKFISNTMIDITDIEIFKEEYYNNITKDNAKNKESTTKDNARLKFYSWCICSFKAINLLLEDKKQLIINPTYQHIIDKYISNINIENDLFIPSDVDNNINEPIKRIRNQLIKQLVLENVDKCYFSDKVSNIKHNNKVFELHHDTFITRNNKYYFEAHHILPFSNADLFCKQNDKNVDSLENLIPLCSNCHRILTFGTSQEIEVFIPYLINHLLINKWTFITIDKLKDFYYKDSVTI